MVSASGACLLFQGCILFSAFKISSSVRHWGVEPLRPHVQGQISILGQAARGVRQRPVAFASVDGGPDLRELIRREDADILSVYSKGGEEDIDEGPFIPDLEEEEVDRIMNKEADRPRACVIVDPFSEFLGKYIRREAAERGLICVDALSPYVAAILGPGVRKFRAPRPGGESLWASQLPYKIEFVLSESDVGLAIAERLQVACGCPGNGINPTRRNKFLTNEALARVGGASAKQVQSRRWADVEAFVDSLVEEREQQATPSSQVPLCVVKPSRGAASGDVFLCRSKEKARKAFEGLLDTPKYGGGLNDKVLVQEYLQGQEYAVDTVSRDGVHKVLAVWKYDKREVNGAPVVYFATELRAAPPGTVEHQVCEYVLGKVLPALDVRWGPTHTEVIDVPGRGPTIVELNARWHLANFKPLCNVCLGYNCLDATLNAFLDPDAFHALPTIPDKLLAGGRIVHLVSFHEGTVTAVNHLDEIRSLPSVRSLELYPDFHVGKDIAKTRDIRSDAGYALLADRDPSVVEKAYQRILELQPSLFNVTSKAEPPPLSPQHEEKDAAAEAAARP